MECASCAVTAGATPKEVKKLSRDLEAKMFAHCNGRLSNIEMEELFSQQSFVIDIPLIAGGGGTATITRPAYGVNYIMRQFTFDGALDSGGSLTRVGVEIVHAGRVLQSFRASNFRRESCCDTLELWNHLCFGWDSEFEIVVTNNNDAGEDFTDGIFDFTQVYPYKGREGRTLAYNSLIGCENWSPSRRY